MSFLLSDLRKIYIGFKDHLQSPKKLQQKVQFDIRFYFGSICRSGNMHAMTKTFFQIIECSGVKYVVKSEELQKHHGTFDKENFSGFMPESKDWDLCPVKSFLFYLGVLHPLCDSLWQRPRNATPDLATW